MADVLLKSGELVQVPIEEMEEYLYANADKIQSRNVKRRGQVRKTTPTENSPVVNRVR